MNTPRLRRGEEIASSSSFILLLRLEHRVTEYCTAFGIDPKCWMRAAQDAPEWYRKVETGAEVFMSAWSTKRVNETNARHAKELFATLPFELP